MKKILLTFVIAILVFSCKTESDVEPAKAQTFIRYFGSENNHTAMMALEADNGYSLLSTVEIPTSALGEFKYKIKFIHTDLYGNLLWEKSYPAFDEPGSMKASSFIPLMNSGYLIIGDRINTDGSTSLCLLLIDLNGNVQNTKEISRNGTSLHGKAVTIDASGNYIVLGNIAGDPLKDMYVSKINAQDLKQAPIWERLYGAGSGTVVNRIYADINQSLLWVGSVKLADKSAIRLVIAPQNSEGTDNGNLFGDPNADEEAGDICQAGNGFAITGTTNIHVNEDIYLTKISNSGNQIFFKSYDFDGQNDHGNAICSSPEGGYVILGTVESGSKGNGREDYYLLKTDASGNQEWAYNYGGSDKEEGASVRSTSDGSYLVFGTTYYGRLGKLMLMKIDKNGKL